MSISSRDRRATIYPYVGVNAVAFATSSYGATRGTFWCRISPIPGDELMLDDQASQSQRAVIEFADEAPVVENDLIVIDAVQWKAGPVTLRRLRRQKVLRVERNMETADLPHA